MYTIKGLEYQIGGGVISWELHDEATSERANSWVVGYLRESDMGTISGNYDALVVVAANGFTKSEYSLDFGWSHY